MLEKRHAHALGGLFDECGDYFATLAGSRPGPREVESAFTSLPEGKTYEDKFAFVLLNREDQLFGHLELIRDYPAQGDWWIGVLLLSPTARGRGLGAEIHDECVRWVKRHGANGLQLSILEENDRAISFWTRLGYNEVDRKGPERFGNKDHRLIVMRKAI